MTENINAKQSFKFSLMQGVVIAALTAGTNYIVSARLFENERKAQLEYIGSQFEAQKDLAKAQSEEQQRLRLEEKKRQLLLDFRYGHERIAAYDRLFWMSSEIMTVEGVLQTKIDMAKEGSTAKEIYLLLQAGVKKGRENVGLDDPQAAFAAASEHYSNLLAKQNRIAAEIDFYFSYSVTAALQKYMMVVGSTNPDTQKNRMMRWASFIDQVVNNPSKYSNANNLFRSADPIMAGMDADFMEDFSRIANAYNLVYDAMLLEVDRKKGNLFEIFIEPAPSVVGGGQSLSKKSSSD